MRLARMEDKEATTHVLKKMWVSGMGAEAKQNVPRCLFVFHAQVLVALRWLFETG